MAISAKYPDPSTWQAPYDVDIKAGIPDQTNPYAQWPDGKPTPRPDAESDADAKLRLANALFENRPWRGPAAQPRSPMPEVPQDRQDPLIAAYRAGEVDAAHLNGRLEDDDALMVRLACASGWYTGTPIAGALTSGQRRQLVSALVCAFTKGIDWKVALGPDPNFPKAVYYDGLTLRNASGEPLGKIAEDLEARIGRVLQARGIAAIAGLDNCAALARQVRRTMTSDPTLSLQPSPDAAYGRPRWLALWTGMQTLAAQGLDPARRDTEDLVAAGLAAGIAITRARARQYGMTSATPLTPGVDMGGLLLMMHADGKLDLRALAQQLATITAERLTAYYKEAFAADLEFIDARAGLDRLQPPTGRELAIANLHAAGVDPEYRIDVDSLVIPTAYGSLRITIPSPFTLYEQSILDFYVSREQVDLNDTPPTDGSTAPAAIPVEQAQARAKLANSLKDEFDAAFDKYMESVAVHTAAMIEASISRYGQHHGVDMSMASITVSQAHRRISLNAPLNFSFLPSVNQDDDSRGYFISIDTPAGKHTYFLTPGTGMELPLPPGAGIDSWVERHQKLVFGTEKKAPVSLDRLTEFHTYTVRNLAAGKRGELASQLKVSMAAMLEHLRADSYGASEIEILRDIQRSLTPFRSTYLAVREGRTEDIPGALTLDALILVPAIGDGVSLGLRAGQALAAGFESAVAAYTVDGVLQALKVGVAQTGSHLPAVGWQAGKLLWTVGKNAVTNPMDVLALLRGGIKLTGEGVRAVIECLKEARPMLAEALSEAARTTGKSIADGRWVLEAMKDAPKSTVAGAGMHGEPLYLRATADNNGRLPLRRYGDRACTRYNPQTLAPEGALLIPDAQGKLYRSLPVDILERYRVSDAGLRHTLEAAQVSRDGTIALGAARYARIDGDYLKLVSDYAAGTPGKPIWRIAGAPLPGTRNGAPRLAWNEDLGMWREPETVPRLNGGGAVQAGAGMYRLSPDAPQMARFHDVLVNGVQGGATPRQADAIKTLLQRMESHPRGSRVLRAMASYYDIMGDAPRIVLHDGPPVPNIGGQHGVEWHLDVDSLHPANDMAAARTLGAVYRKMANLDGAMAGAAFRTALAEEKVPVDPALETAWQRWIDDASGAARSSRVETIDALRIKVQEARFYGGVKKDLFVALLGDRPGTFALTAHAEYGSVLDLNEMQLIGGLPPLPDDLEMLHLLTNEPPSKLENLPANLQCLKIEKPGLASIAHANSSVTLPTLPESLRELVVARYPGLTELPVRLPAGLHRLEVANCGLTRLSALPSGLKTLALPNNRLTVLPDALPQGLQILRVSHNQLSRLPDSVATLTSAVIDIRGNPFDPAYVRNFRDTTASRIVFAAPTPQDADVGQTIRAILGNDHPEAIGRWQAIQRAAAPASQEAANIAEFSRYLDQLSKTSGYQDLAFRKEVQDLLVELSKPERQSLRGAAMGLCETVRNVCHDRSAWMMSELRKAKLNDDILLGQYDGKVGEVVDVARQMFRADRLVPIARKTAAGLGMQNEELEVQLAYAVKLRPDDALGLKAMVPDMDYFGVVRLTDEDLKSAKELVLAQELTDFDKFFVTRYEPWQSMLKRNFGSRYDDAKALLAEQTAGEAFERRVDAKLTELGMPLGDADARRAAEAAVASDMEYDAYLPLTREYLASAAVSYLPKSPEMA